MSDSLSYFSYSKFEGETNGFTEEGEVGGGVVATVGEGESSSKMC